MVSVVSGARFVRADMTLQMRLHEEALYGRLPLLDEERTLTRGRSMTAGINAAMMAWCFLVGGYTANVMDASRGAIALVTGSVCSVVLMTLLMMGCNRYGCDATDLSKTCLGQRGAKLILTVHLLCQLTWSALVFAMFAQGVRALFEMVGFSGSEDVLRLIILVGMLAGWLLVSRRSHGIALLSTASTPGALMLAALVLFVVLREVTLADLARIPPLIDVHQTERAGVAAFTYGLGSGFCWWPIIGNLSRNARDVRTAVYPQILTMGCFTGLMASIGLWAALLFRSFDPNDWLAHMGGTAFGMLTLSCLACTHLAGAAASLFGIAHSLRHVRLLRGLSWELLTALPFVCLAPLLLGPSYVYGHGHVLLILIAYALTPLACVLAVDYLALRKQRVNLSQIYDDSRHAIYWYWGGINWLSLASIVCGVAISLLAFNPVTHATHPVLHGLGGAPLGGLVATALHVLCVRWVLRPRGLGGYRAPTAPQAILYYNL